MRRVTLLVLLGAAPLSAQQLRDYSYARQIRKETQLRAVIEFAAGTLILRPGAGDKLYDYTLRYDAERFRPIGRYDEAAAEVHLGVLGIGNGGIRINRKDALPQTALVALPAGPDLSLDISLGAAESTLDLGGLRLSELEVKSGASRTTVNFSSPTRGSCRVATITSGAGQLTVNRAGNSGCKAWRFEGGVGEVNVDLAGAWTADSRMTLNVALGGVNLTAPRDLGLRVRMSGFLADFSAKGFKKDGRTYTSDNYTSAKRHLEVEVNSALGGVSVVWK